MKYSLDQVLTFIHVVETSNFTQAAQRLNMSKAIVSQRVTALEAHLGTQLFIRTTRKLDLTDAGAEFYAAVKDVYQQMESAMERVQSHQSVAKGRLRVITRSGFALALRHHFIPQFVSRYPDVILDIRIVEDPFACLGDDFDLVIMPHIKGTPLPDMHYVATPLFTSPVGIFATPAYLAAQGDPKKPDDLLRHNGMAAFSGLWPFRRAGGEIHYLDVPGNVRVNDDNVIKSIVKKDLVLAYTYVRLFENELGRGEVVPVLTKDTQLELEVYAIYPQSYYMPYKLRVFLDHIKAFYAKEQAKIDRLTY